MFLVQCSLYSLEGTFQEQLFLAQASVGFHSASSYEAWLVLEPGAGTSGQLEPCQVTGKRGITKAIERVIFIAEE